jgi:uroporphyrinogen III methyltransferase/synthase
VLERATGGVAALADRRVAAIGSGTARALVARGVVPAIVPAEHVAEALIGAITEALGPRLRGARILLARALEAREVLPEALGAAGATVDVVAVYRTVKAGPERAAELRELLEQRRVDAVLITSASTIDSVFRLLGPDAPRLLEPCCLASIGPVSTAAARGHGLRVDVTAETSTIAGLVGALEPRLRRSSAGRTAT